MAKISEIEKKYMPLPLSIERGNAMPLDTTSVYYPTFDAEKNEILSTALANAANYAKNNPTAYVGQIIQVIEGVFVDGVFVADATHLDTGVYLIAGTDGLLIKLMTDRIYEDNKLENIEIDYENALIEDKDEETGEFRMKIISPKVFKVLSDVENGVFNTHLYINGVQYNPSEYKEFKETIDGIRRTGIYFYDFILTNDDEITIEADYE